MEKSFPAKRCPKCEALKSPSEFHRNKHGKNGLNGWCKNCQNESNKRWPKQHPEKVRETHKRWRLKNPEKVYASTRKWQKKHSEQYGETNRRWKKNNPERVKQSQRKTNAKRSATSRGILNYRMGNNIRLALRQNKANRHWETLVGYTVNDLKRHLESLFSEGMTWGNMGQWHIDHIIPMSRFYYDVAESPEFKICWGLSNLQPLWAKDNLSKNAKTMEEWKETKCEI